MDLAAQTLPARDSAPGGRWLRWFDEVGLADVPLVGGKNASLGEMVRALGPLGIRVPGGFAVTADAYRHVLDQADAWPRLRQALDGLDVRDVNELGDMTVAVGQAPSDDPEMARSLVAMGIDSISVTPDTLLSVARVVLNAEAGLGRPSRKQEVQ